MAHVSGILFRHATPGINDDSTLNHYVGQIWVDLTAKQFYQCDDASTGAAVWTGYSKGVFGNDFQNVDSPDEIISTNEAYTRKPGAELTTPAGLNGTYQLTYDCDVEAGANRTIEVRAYNDTDAEVIQGPQQWKSNGNGSIHTLTGHALVVMSGTAKTFGIDYKKVGVGGSVIIRKTGLFWHRIT